MQCVLAERRTNRGGTDSGRPPWLTFFCERGGLQRLMPGRASATSQTASGLRRDHAEWPNLHQLGTLRLGDEHVHRRVVILAEAYRESEKIRGAGDSKASQIYAQAFGQNPEFFKFYRSLEAYRASFKNRHDVMVVDPSSEFFKYFKGIGAGSASTSKK